MKAAFSFDGHYFEITTNHSASSYGRPVLLVDGEVTDVEVELDDDAGTAVDQEVAGDPD